MKRGSCLGLALSLWLLSGQVLSARPAEMLTMTQLAKLKRKPCSFIEVWATWSSVSLQQMPDLVAWLEKRKQINPIIVDVSKPFLQEQVAKKWKILGDASFPTYLKPGGNDSEYQKAIDNTFNNSLPYAVLYHHGKRRKYWRGVIDLAGLDREVARLCK